VIVELRGEHAGFAVRTIHGFDLLHAGLVPQPDADQNEKRKGGRRDQSEQLRADPRELRHREHSERTRTCGRRRGRNRSKPGSSSQDRARSMRWRFARGKVAADSGVRFNRR
jgi:hypothetical protein